MKIDWSRIKGWMRKLKTAAIGLGIAVAAQSALANGGPIDFSGTLNTTNGTIVLTNNATFNLPQNGDGIAILLSATATAVGAGTNGWVTEYFDLLDSTGTLFSSTNQIILTMGLNGATNVTQFFYVAPTNFWGASAARLGKHFSNQTNTGVTLAGKWMAPTH